jgi:hypothetical protein
MPPRNEWPAMIADALVPALTACFFAAFALDPQRFPEDYSLWLAGLFLAELPLSLLGGVFAAVAVGLLDCPVPVRVLTYLVIVGVLGIAGLSPLIFDTHWGPILAWSVLGHLVRLAFLRRDLPLAGARLEAVAKDCTNLVILLIWGGVLATAIGAALNDFAHGTLERLHVTLEMTDLAWVAVIYFVLRGWSAAYANSAAFALRAQGYFDRPSINWMVDNLGRSKRASD